MNNTYSRDIVLKVIENERINDSGLVVGYTSGTFDILHTGHVTYLKEAKELCDILVVGLNSDYSVRQYKSSLRPINNQFDRAEVLSSLDAVDYVFIFNEVNNNTNIKQLEPDIYIKAGDYKVEQLSSTPIVKSYGGEVKILSFVTGCSTTSIIEKCAVVSSLSAPKQKEYDRKPALFVDRDGTLIKLVDYISEAEKVELIDDAVKGLKKFSDAGFRLIVTTNQPGIGLGYFKVEDFYKVTLQMFKLISKQGVLFDKVYFSPAGKGDKCSYRKPNTGMIQRAVDELNINIEDSIVIGDSTADIEFAKRAGCKSGLVKTGKAGLDALFDVEPDYKGNSILEIADQFL